jgi:PAS domain S-box-containing protein
MHHDFYIFAGLVLVLGVAFGWWMWKRLRLTRAWMVLFLVTAGVLGTAWLGAGRAGEAERDRQVEMLRSLTATYAGEIQFLGHPAITMETPPDDPVYLTLIGAQKRWLAANRQINDVYTVRLNAAGSPALIVDSETDYDHNGRFDDGIESRTKIGEVWEEQDDALDCALRGKGAFSPEETHDRWGDWFSYYTPLWKADGSLDGALGIDLKSSTVLADVGRARLGALQNFGLLYLAFIVLLGGLGAAVLGRRGARERELTAETARERQKMENLVLAVEGIVWESGPDPASCAYVSQQAEEMIGWPQAQWTQDLDFWQRRLHADDRQWAMRQRRLAVENNAALQIEYRMIHRDGSELWVRERGSVHQGERGKVLRGVITDITEHKNHTRELERSQKQLMEASHQAGMAEVATGVLHNVGNVLNSVNISSGLITDAVRKSSLPTLKNIATLLLDQTDLPAFMAGPRGQAIPSFLSDLHSRMSREQESLNKETLALTSSVEHIKEIVMMQQSYARMGGRSEPLHLEHLVEDALHINSAALTRHRVELIKDYQAVPAVQVERNKVLQILVNLLRNAKHAIDDANPPERLLRITICQGPDGFVNVIVSDNGLGIPPENLERLFSYGFTTRKTGHGFGLHSSVNTAREMGGALTAASAGLGHGASFCLSLPAAGPIEKSTVASDAAPDISNLTNSK